MKLFQNLLKFENSEILNAFNKKNNVDRYDKFHSEKSAKVSLLKDEIKQQTQSEFEIKLDDLYAGYKALCLKYIHDNLISIKETKQSNDKGLKEVSKSLKNEENLEYLLDGMEEENAEEFYAPDPLKLSFYGKEAKDYTPYELDETYKKFIRQACYVLKNQDYDFEEYTPFFEDMSDEFVAEYTYILQQAMELVSQFKADKQAFKAQSTLSNNEEKEETEDTKYPFQKLRKSQQAQEFEPEVDDTEDTDESEDYEDSEDSEENTDISPEEKVNNISSKGRRQRKSSKERNS